MTMQLSAVAIIENLIPYMDDIQDYYINVPRGSFIGNGSPYRSYAEKSHTAERVMSLADDLLGVSGFALYSAVLIARRWYNLTEWQKCLPEEVATRLLNCMMEQYPKYR